MLLWDDLHAAVERLRDAVGRGPRCLGSHAAQAAPHRHAQPAAGADAGPSISRISGVALSSKVISMSRLMWALIGGQGCRIKMVSSEHKAAKAAKEERGMVWGVRTSNAQHRTLNVEMELRTGRWRIAPLATSGRTGAGRALPVGRPWRLGGEKYPGFDASAPSTLEVIAFTGITIVPTTIFSEASGEMIVFRRK